MCIFQHMQSYIFLNHEEIFIWHAENGLCRYAGTLLTIYNNDIVPLVYRIGHHSYTIAGYSSQILFMISIPFAVIRNVVLKCVIPCSIAPRANNIIRRVHYLWIISQFATFMTVSMPLPPSHNRKCALIGESYIQQRIHLSEQCVRNWLHAFLRFLFINLFLCFVLLILFNYRILGFSLLISLGFCVFLELACMIYAVFEALCATDNNYERCYTINEVFPSFWSACRGKHWSGFSHNYSLKMNLPSTQDGQD